MMFLATIWGIAVMCGPIGGTSAGEYLFPPTNQIVLANILCSRIRRHVANPYSIFVLAHEEGHAHDPYLKEPANTAYRLTCNINSLCEQFADCWGASRFMRLARELGWSFKEALSMKREAMQSVGWTYGVMPRICWRS